MIGQLLDKARDYYLTRFTQAVELALETPSTHVVTEAALLNADGLPVNDGPLGLPLRSDLLILKDGAEPESKLIDTEGMLSFDPVAFEWEGGLKVSLGGFQWNALQVTLHGVSRSPSWSPLQAWFRSAFGDPQRSGDGTGFLEVVHFMSDPTLKRGVLSSSAAFSVDLGSAPVEAFESLLDAVGELKPKKVELGGTVAG